MDQDKVDFHLRAYWSWDFQAPNLWRDGAMDFNRLVSDKICGKEVNYRKFSQFVY